MRLNKVIQAVMKVVKFKMILTVENAPIGAVQKTREIGAIDFMRVRRILGSTVVYRPTSGDVSDEVGFRHSVNSGAANQSTEKFLNPYNFVRPLSLNNGFFKKQTPPSHAVYKGLSGHLVCNLEVITPLFISNGIPTVSDEYKGHQIHQFFSIGGEKVIPGSSLRGMIRGIYEAATDSCYSIFDDQFLTRRMEAKEGQGLIPARIINGGKQLELLKGKMVPGYGTILNVAWIRLYKTNNPIKLKGLTHGKLLGGN